MDVWHEYGYLKGWQGDPYEHEAHLGDATRDLMYPFIDIAVHDAIRTLFSEGEALAVVTPDFEELIWANGVAAKLFKHASIYDFLDSGFIDDKKKKKKLKETARQLMDNPIISSANLEISNKDHEIELNLSLKLITLPRGEPAVLLIINGHNSPHYGILDVEHVIAGFADTGTCVAVLGNQGQVLSATEQFYALDVSLIIRRELTEQVSSEEDRLVKRLIETHKGELPAAIGHLNSQPDMFLLFAIDENAEISGADVTPIASAQVASENTGNETGDEIGDDGLKADFATDEAAPIANKLQAHTPEHKTDTDQATQDVTSTQGSATKLDEDSAAAKGHSNQDHGDKNHGGPIDGDQTPDFVFNPNQRTVRFVWRTDAAAIFTEISPELGAALGPNAADIVGRRFTDVALVFNLTPRDEIIELIRRRDTWSGKTVLWPVQGTDLRVPVDLAALPTYTRDRLFDGYRGFGVARVQEAVKDPEGLGFSLGLHQTASHEPIAEPSDTNSAGRIDTDGGESTGETRDDTRDDIGAAERVSDAKKVVPIDKLRRQAEENLTKDEQAAFFEIRRHLNKINSDMDDGQSLDDAHSELDADPEEPLLDAADDDAPDNLEAETPIDAPSEYIEETDDAEDDLTSEQLDDVDMDAPVDEQISDQDTDEENDDLPTVSATHELQDESDDLAADNQGQLEIALQESQAQNERLQSKLSDLNSILETATDGIVIFDQDSSIQSLNASASALFNYDPDDIVGQPFTVLFAPQSQNAVLDYVDAMKDHGVASILNDGREVLALVSSGGTLPLSMTIGHLGGSGGYCAVLRDLSQTKKAEQELTSAKSVAEKANAHKTDFLTRVSHEIRTPLNAIIGFADMIAQERFGLVGHNRYIEYAHDIGKSGRHVLDIVNDLLDISKIEAGKQELEFQSVSLNDEITSALSLMHPLANESRVIVRSSLPSNVPNVVADQRSIKQILLNILSNSIKHTPAGGQVVVSSSLEATGHVLLRIRDNGKGMSRTELERALQPFGQVGDNARDKGEGTGLGLPLTRAMAEANRANFDIVSAPGDGTLVTINFPPQRVLTE